MNKKQNFILEYYHIIVVLIAVINIITTVKTESYSNIGRILFILDRCIFNTFLTLLLSKLWRKFVKNNLFDLLASFIISLFVSILFVIFETICGIQMGDVVKTVAIWFIYCFMSYIINYYWIKCNLCDRIASVFGYAFDDNIATVNNNTIKFPEKLKDNEMFICILKDKRIIIASKEEIEFRKIFNNAVSLKNLDDYTVEFNEDLQNLITMDSYEIVEHNGWYELLPLEE